MHAPVGPMDDTSTSLSEPQRPQGARVQGSDDGFALGHRVASSLDLAKQLHFSSRPPAALLGDGDGALKARKTGWRMDRAVVVEGARRREGEPIGPAERIAPQRRAKLATVPDADVARRGMRRGSFVGPLDRRAHLNAQRGRREREVLNGDRRDRAPRHPAARGHREPLAGGELAGSAEQNERVQYRGAEHATPANSYPVRHWAAPGGGNR